MGGCDAFGRRCAGEDVTGIAPEALDACCACGGGLTAKEKQYEIMAVQQMHKGEKQEAPCKWVTVASGEHAWQCKEGLYVICANDDACRTTVNVALLGGGDWECHIAAGEEEGLCVPPNDTPMVLLETVAPAANGESFFQALPSGLDLTRLSEFPDSDAHPCCCDHLERPTLSPPDEVEGTSLMERTTPQADEEDHMTEVMDELAKVEEAARSIKDQVTEMGGVTVDNGLKGKNPHGTCTGREQCICPMAPPVTVLKFRLVSSNGVGVTGGRLRQMDAFQPGGEECSEGGACIGLREVYNGKTVDWDPAENVAEMSSVEVALPTAPNPLLPAPHFTEAPPPVLGCAAGGGLCEQQAMAYVIFLVDMSASSLAASREGVSFEISQMYGSLCHSRKSTANGEMVVYDDVPGHKRCGVYAFDGREGLLPILPVSPTQGPVETETLAKELAAFQSEDPSTDLYGALVGASQLMGRLPRKNMTTFTVVLVTDGEERANRVSKKAVVAALESEKEASYFVLYVKPPGNSAHSQRAEEFLCKNVLSLEDPSCCTDSPGDAHTCSMVQSPADVDLSAKEMVEAANREGLSAKEDEARLTAKFQEQLGKAKDTALAVQERRASGSPPIPHAPDEAVDIALAHNESSTDTSNGTAAEEDIVTEHELAKRISDHLRQKFQGELAAVKEKVEKYARMKAEAEEAIEVAMDRRYQEEKIYSHNAKVMLASWKRHIRVTQSLFRASHYQLGFCSSFRPGGLGEPDVRKGVVHIHGDDGEGEDRDTSFKFSSKTFRVSLCDRATVLAALGLGALPTNAPVDSEGHQNLTVASSEVQDAEREGTGSFAAAAKSVPTKKSVAKSGGTSLAAPASLLLAFCVFVGKMV